MTIDAVLFDCDGVLVDSEIVGLEDSTEFLRSQGFPWSPEDLIRRFIGKRDDLFRAELLEGYQEVLGRVPSPSEADALYDGLIAARRASSHLMRPIEGALETLKQIADSRLKSAVASSSRQIYLDRKIERYGFGHHISPHVYSAERVDRGKPSPDIFLYAAEKIGMDPAVCLVIEDSPFGVEAGVAAGMQVWGFTGGGHCLADHDRRLTEAGALRTHACHAALQQDLTSVIEEH